jgi:CDP-diacylglycerol--glycerol-3-phosphate 3-phosphatidyltransferase
VSGSLVSPATRQRVRDLATPIATALGRLGLTPNALTLIGFAGTVVAAWAAASQWWLAAGILVLLFGIFDLFDGTLARATGQATKLGAFLDSTFDRAGEAIVFIGISIGLLAAGFREGAILAAGAMAGSFMVSYTRAKSESLGFTPGTGMANVGIMPREVRLAILSVALILATEPIYAVPPPGAACMGVCDFPQGGSISIGLLVIAIGSVITTIQRIAHVVAQSREG